jgi:hypothetical protein
MSPRCLQRETRMSSAPPAQKHRRECQPACYAVKSSKNRNGFGYSPWWSLDPVAALADRKVDSAICLGARCLSRSIFYFQRILRASRRLAQA